MTSLLHQSTIVPRKLGLTYDIDVDYRAVDLLVKLDEVARVAFAPAL